MKNHFLFVMLGSFALSISSLSFNYHKNYFRTSFVIFENSNTYKMSASYEEEKTRSVIQYIDKCLQPELIFKNTEQLDEKLTLKDKTTFYLQFMPGEMKIKLIKSENSNASLMRIKKLCAGLNSVLNR